MLVLELPNSLNYKLRVERDKPSPVGLVVLYLIVASLDDLSAVLVRPGKACFHRVWSS